MELVYRYMKRQELKESYFGMMAWENRMKKKNEIKLMGTTAEKHWIERKLLDRISRDS